MQVPRDLGLVTYATMLLWLTALFVLFGGNVWACPWRRQKLAEIPRMAA